MNNVIVLCVGLMGAANPAHETTENSKSVQVAFAGCNLANGGCYGQPTYRSPVVQNGSFHYSSANCNCPPGACAQGRCSANCPQCNQVSYSAGTAANCPNGQCAPRSYSSYSAGTAANCPNGQCQFRGSNNASGRCYGPNCPQQNRIGYYPATTTQYNPLPTRRYPVGRYTQPRRNPNSAGRTYNVNWSNTYRPVQPSNSYNSNTNSPFFN